MVLLRVLLWIMTWKDFYDFTVKVYPSYGMHIEFVDEHFMNSEVLNLQILWPYKNTAY